MGTSCKYMILCHWILLRMRNASDKSCRANQNTHLVFKNLFLKIGSFMRQCGKIWLGADQQRWQCKRCICFAYLVAQATDTHSEYVIFIAFPRQQGLCECTTLLRLCVRCLSCSVCFCCNRGIWKLFEGQCSVYIRTVFLVGAAGCACTDLQAKLTKQFTAYNVGMKGCVRFLFPPYFLLQFSVSSVAFSAVLSTVTHLPQDSPMYLQQ